jgi:hypothetical protein
MNLHELLGLGPEEFIRFCNMALLILIMTVASLASMAGCYARGRERGHDEGYAKRRREDFGGPDVIAGMALRSTIKLLNCMIDCGEKHSDESRLMVRRALHPDEFKKKETRT